MGGDVGMRSVLGEGTTMRFVARLALGQVEDIEGGESLDAAAPAPFVPLTPAERCRG